MRACFVQLVLASLSLTSASGCIQAVYEWDAADVAGIDATMRDVQYADGPAALQGRIHYPGHTGPGGPGAPAPGVLRVSVYPVPMDSDAASADVNLFDVPNADVASAVATSPACAGMNIGPPAYSLSIYPAPDPAFYRFDNVPPGYYCVFVELDMPPFYSPPDDPSCDDLQATATDVEVEVPLTTAPDLYLHAPPRCP